MTFKERKRRSYSRKYSPRGTTQSAAKICDVSAVSALQEFSLSNSACSVVQRINSEVRADRPGLAAADHSGSAPGFAEIGRLACGGD